MYVFLFTFKIKYSFFIAYIIFKVFILIPIFVKTIFMAVKLEEGN